MYKIKNVVVIITILSFLIIPTSYYVFQENNFNYNIKKESQLTKEILFSPIILFAKYNTGIMGGLFHKHSEELSSLFVSKAFFDTSFENAYSIRSHVFTNKYSYSIDIFYFNNCRRSKELFNILKVLYDEKNISEKIEKKEIKKSPIIIRSNITNTEEKFYKYYPYDYFSISYYDIINKNQTKPVKLVLFRYKHSVFVLFSEGEKFDTKYNLTPSFRALVDAEEWLKSQQTFYKKYFEDEC